MALLGKLLIVIVFVWKHGAHMKHDLEGLLCSREGGSDGMSASQVTNGIQTTGETRVALELHSFTKKIKKLLEVG